MNSCSDCIKAMIKEMDKKILSEKIRLLELIYSKCLELSYDNCKITILELINSYKSKNQ
jgi:hypothetical protein